MNTEDVSPRLERPDKAGRAGTLEHHACDLVTPSEVRRALRRPGPQLRASANNSFDLSICDWRGEGVALVKLLVDAAPSAELRFFNQLSEQLQFHNADPARRPRQIKGVGRDSAYGRRRRLVDSHGVAARRLQGQDDPAHPGERGRAG